MDDVFTMKLKSNGLRFKQTLDRLADKYGKLQQCEDEPLEVDMDKTLVETLEHYMALSKKKVETLSKSFVDYKADSQPLRDGTIYSQGNDTSVESGHLETVYLPGQDEATSLLDDSCTIFDQPEDHDEQLEMSLQSQGSSLGEVYMDMLSQIGEACQRQHVSDAADSVSMKYRRLRESKRQPNNSLLQVQKPINAKKIINKPHHVSISPVKSLVSPLIKDGSQSPVNKSRQKSNLFYPRRETPTTATVMDMSAICEQYEKVQNHTFRVSEPSLSYSTYISSPPRFSCPPNSQANNQLFRMSECCRSPRHLQTAGYSGYEPESSPFKERPEYSSPVRRSPYQSRLASRNSFGDKTDIYGSAVTKSPFKLHLSRSPKSPYMKQSRCKSTSNLASPMSPKIAARRKSLDYPNLRLSSQLGSPQMDKARRHHSLRRNLSFDSSSLTSSHDFDNDFKKLYHQLVCLNKTMKVPPCKFCLKSPDAASREHSSLNLAALALSPHQRLGKRHELNNYPQSKRFKDGHFTKYL
ncbi:unnamed protein product [Knipowitschia caucasica]